MDFTLSKKQRDLVEEAREFASREFGQRALEFDRSETFDLGIWRAAAERGFVGLHIPVRYGGSGLGLLERCLVMEEFWSEDPGIASAVLSTTFGSDMFTMFGTEEQNSIFLRPVAEGNAILAMAITEPNAGSDVSGVQTRAEQSGDEYVISGSKVFITNGSVADFVLVLCLTDPEHAKKHMRFSCIVVEKHRKGFQANKLYGKLGIRASDTAELFFSDVRVPKTNLVGEQGGAFRQLMKVSDRARIGVAAQGVGIARAALEESIRHSRKRFQFGSPLALLQATQFKIAEMATRVKCARNLYYEAAWKADKGIADSKLAAMAKWYAGEVAVFCANEALEMHGGYGCLDEHKVQRLYRDAKIIDIYEGTKEIEKLIIARNLLSS
ncbi:MAG: acyl-CoA dehydrogenase family protein [Deltaproteobacteria bacterium]|nr:acyl-CoA dehydrogenase family protein [Deltaproteobacteria bacterium]